MSEKRKYDDGNDGESMEGYFHNVTPYQCSIDGNIYNRFNLQTTPEKKKEEFAGHGAKKYNKLSRLFESMSPP